MKRNDIKSNRILNQDLINSFTGDKIHSCPLTLVQSFQIEYDNYCSDLLIPVTDETTKLIKNYMYKKNVKTFICKVTKKPWYELPFAYYPYNSF